MSDVNGDRFVIAGCFILLQRYFIVGFFAHCARKLQLTWLYVNECHLSARLSVVDCRLMIWQFICVMSDVEVIRNYVGCRRNSVCGFRRPFLFQYGTTVQQQNTNEELCVSVSLSV